MKAHEVFLNELQSRLTAGDHKDKNKSVSGYCKIVMKQGNNWKRAEIKISV